MPNHPLRELFAVAEAFEREGIPYFIVGAFAVMVHGAPRTTNDVDIAAHVEASDHERVRSVLASIGLQQIERRRDEMGERFVGQPPAGLKVEVFLTRPGNVVHAREFARRVNVDVEGRTLPFQSPEDLVLRKLVNTRLRRGPDLDDAIRVAAVQGGRLDTDYLRKHCGLYRICDLLERVLQEAATLEPGPS